MDELKIKSKTYTVSEELQTLCEAIIDERNIEVADARIRYELVYPNISKKVAGKCIPGNPRMRFYGECEYIISMSGELWDSLDENRKYILAYHELLHILVVMNDKTGEWDYKIRKHDIEDFSMLTNEFGTEWFTELKAINSSLYDLDPKQSDDFRVG